MIDFKAIKDRVLAVLEEKLPDYLTYHCVAHTKYVMKKTKYIATKEGVLGHDLLLLQLAALYHDYGFIEGPAEHEKISCGYAREQLMKEGISEEDMKKIEGMIMATKIPQQPKTHLEKILADADLEYLATTHFEEVGELLYQELKHYNPDFSRKAWTQLQIDFISNHHYHTKFCRHYKEKYKRRHLEELREMV